MAEPFEYAIRKDVRNNPIVREVDQERQRELWFKTQDAIDQTVERQLIRRVLLGDEIARAALFLAADDSRMITKQSITVDAGLR